MPRGIHGNSSTSYFEIRTRNAEVSFKMGFLGLLRKSKGIPMDSHASEIQNVIMADSVSKFLEFRTYGSPDGAKKWRLCRRSRQDNTLTKPLATVLLTNLSAAETLEQTPTPDPLERPTRRTCDSDLLHDRSGVPPVVHDAVLPVARVPAGPTLAGRARVGSCASGVSRNRTAVG